MCPRSPFLLVGLTQMSFHQAWALLYPITPCWCQQFLPGSQVLASLTLYCPHNNHEVFFGPCLVYQLPHTPAICKR